MEGSSAIGSHRGGCSYDMAGRGQARSRGDPLKKDRHLPDRRRETSMGEEWDATEARRQNHNGEDRRLEANRLLPTNDPAHSRENRELQVGAGGTRQDSNDEGIAHHRGRPKCNNWKKGGPELRDGYLWAIWARQDKGGWQRPAAMVPIPRAGLNRLFL